MALSKYWQSTLNGSTCCHSVKLKGGLTGIYNGLASWGTVVAGDGCTTIEDIWLDPEIDEENGETYQPNFTPQDFVNAGYALDL